MDRRDDELAGEVARRPGDVRHRDPKKPRAEARGLRVNPPFAFHCLPERGLGLRENFCSVGDHEHPRRPAELAAYGDYVERCKPGFPKARGHSDEGF